MEFSTITGEIVLKSKVKGLSVQDKVNLFCYLLDELGIKDRLVAEPNTDRFVEIIDEQINKAFIRKD